MSTPLHVNAQSSGGAYGTHSSNGGRNARQRRNPSDYGIFSSPHGSFDEPVSFPPYAELPFTSLKRRREIKNSNSIVKFAMQAVLLSPVIVLVLWSVAAVMFSHKVGHKNRNNNNNNKYGSGKNSLRKNGKQPNYFGNGVKTAQSPAVYANGMVVQSQLLDAHGNPIYYADGYMMMMSPQQQQQHLQGGYSTGQQPMSNNLQQLSQGQPVPMQVPGQQLPIVAPLGNGFNTNVVPSNGLQGVILQQQQQMPLVYTDANGMNQPVLTSYGATGQQPLQSINNNNIAQASATIRQQPQQLTESSDVISNNNNNVVQAPAAVLQQQQQPIQSLDQASVVLQQQPLSGSSGATQDKLQESPAKQAIYFYDPKQTTTSKAGDILSMPTLVYDINGKAVPLAELQHKAPIYVQSPVRGATPTGEAASIDAGHDVVELVSPSARGASLVHPSSREAIAIPQSWGTSTSQDQTIIVATVAVMALLVGALSARRLRSKSFLSACIENESLEDDMAYDDAYTTTAAASGAMGADSSYNTFGGWKGDLEKFDV
eukprot:CAMPEP_0201117108 /NCGR_PEP_ID=MMETSP0850-20130426/1183_1 /ASSEMBLY_ACC=CAM_ASM_000622 /TAXON_ID=183588 /ORGANISM="Pseudo-nitzschia fraudulenta, Strain WWA7" /LENGTH=541 /DNA_ID=CAMNT_0047381349 /DNA_START=153 /DNA_END=1778 /DNA_ORIENTATION=-